jgi:hypothetical protein
MTGAGSRGRTDDLLINPPEDKWDDHFEQNGVVIEGHTAIRTGDDRFVEGERRFWLRRA